MGCGRVYRRRAGQDAVVHRVVREGLGALRASSDSHGGLPRHFLAEVRGFLRCGCLAHGFTRVRCTACGDESLVAFSCKGRGLCPSCSARRAHVTAAHLVDDVLPRAPYRQWTLSFPFRLRWVLVKTPRLLAQLQRALFLARGPAAAGGAAAGSGGQAARGGGHLDAVLRERAAADAALPLAGAGRRLRRGAVRRGASRRRRRRLRWRWSGWRRRWCGERASCWRGTGCWRPTCRRRTGWRC